MGGKWLTTAETDEATRPTELAQVYATGHGRYSFPFTKWAAYRFTQSTALHVPKKVPKKNWWLRIAVVVAVLVGAGASYYWWHHLHSQLPSGVACGNGRLEADAIDIDTKYAGRIAEMLADEGDMVKAGQVVGRMDTRDLEASLKKAQAQVRQAQRAVEEADANVTQQEVRCCWQSSSTTAPPIGGKGNARPRKSWTSDSNSWTGPRPRSTRRICG